MGEKTAILCTSVCCLLIFALPVPIVSTVMGAIHANDPCQVIDPVGLNLSNWLIGAGIGGLISVLGIMTLLIMMIGFGSEVAFILMIALKIMNALFGIIYSTIGAVVLFRSNMDCLNNGTDLGIMSLVVLIFYWLGILANCCGNKNPNNDD